MQTLPSIPGLRTKLTHLVRYIILYVVIKEVLSDILQSQKLVLVNSGQQVDGKPPCNVGLGGRGHIPSFYAKHVINLHTMSNIKI